MMRKLSFFCLAIILFANLSLAIAADGKPLKVVVFGGHPDDPESGCGGLIATLTAARHEVHVGYATCFRGDRKINGQPEADVRRHEAAEACRILGARPRFFDYAHEKLTADAATRDAVSDWLTSISPDIVVTHWPLDMHPNHHAASSLVWQCYQRQGGWNLYFFEVMTGSQTIGFQPALYLDLTPVLQKKKECLEAHTSQNPASIWEVHEKMHKARGKECGVERAEAYQLLEAKPGGKLLPVKWLKPRDVNRASAVNPKSPLPKTMATPHLAAERGLSLHQQIDMIIAKRWDELRIAPAAISDDAEFVRRVYLDLTGIIPTARQARAFLDDGSADKRSRLIDELLASPDYVLNMSRVFDVMLTERRIPAISSYDVPSTTWRTYLAGAFAENKPWDQMVRDILGSDGTDEKHAAAVKFYLVRDVSPHQLARDVGRLFLGIDLQCAQCHDDPRIEDYRQVDYFGIYAFLQRVTPYRDMQKNVSLVGETAVGKTTFTSVFTAKSGETNPRLPGGEMIPDPEIEQGKEYVVKPGPKDRGVPTYSRRLKLAEQMSRPETHGFSRNIANRLWAMLLGRGIVYPLDLHHKENPPSHPELLDLLERWLVEHKYDIKALLREIALSETYQRSSVLPQGVKELPDEAFAVAPLRGLTAEQLRWSLLQATGRIELHFAKLDEQQKKAPDKSGDAEPAWKVNKVRYEALERQSASLITAFAGLPGQPEGDFQPIVDQALYLLNSSKLLPLLQNEPGTVQARLTAISEIEPLAEELYLSVLGRRPAAEEIAEVRRLIEPSKTPAERRERLQVLTWGLLLSAEFRLNH